MIRPKNETEHLLLSLTKNCETLIRQTHRNAEETLESKLNESRKTFHFNPQISIEGSWMIIFTSLEVCKSTFNIDTTNNKFELYIDVFDEISIEELKDELEEILSISDITTSHPQYEKMGPHINAAYNHLRSE